MAVARGAVAAASDSPDLLNAATTTLSTTRGGFASRSTIETVSTLPSEPPALPLSSNGTNQRSGGSATRMPSVSTFIARGRIRPSRNTRRLSIRPSPSRSSATTLRESTVRSVFSRVRLAVTPRGTGANESVAARALSASMNVVWCERSAPRFHGLWPPRQLLELLGHLGGELRGPRDATLRPPGRRICALAHAGGARTSKKPEVAPALRNYPRFAGPGPAPGALRTGPTRGRPGRPPPSPPGCASVPLPGCLWACAPAVRRAEASCRGSRNASGQTGQPQYFASCRRRITHRARRCSSLASSYPSDRFLPPDPRTAEPHRFTPQLALYRNLRHALQQYREGPPPELPPGVPLSAPPRRPAIKRIKRT